MESITNDRKWAVVGFRSIRLVQTANTSKETITPARSSLDAIRSTNRGTTKLSM